MNEMELADPRLLDQLIKSPAPPKPRLSRPEKAARDLQRAAPRAPKRRSRRCACGRCSFCLENQRWERIFQEKFADPQYYRDGPNLRRGSSLQFE